MNNMYYINEENNNVSTQNVEVKEKRIISKSIYISFESFLDLDEFINNLSLLKYGRRYILLVRLNYKNVEQKGKETFV